MVKLKHFIPLLLCGCCINLVLTETVGIKENLKDLDDDDVLVISVAHAKKDTKNSTVEKLVSRATESTTEAADKVDSLITSTASKISSLTTTTTTTDHPVVKKDVKPV